MAPRGDVRHELGLDVPAQELLGGRPERRHRQTQPRRARVRRRIVRDSGERRPKLRLLRRRERLAHAQVREFAHVRVAARQEPKQTQVERRGEAGRLEHGVRAVHRVHVVTAAKRVCVFDPRVVPAVEHGVGAEPLGAHRGSLLRGHHRQVLLSGAFLFRAFAGRIFLRNLDDAVQRRARRGAGGQKHFQAAVARLQHERVRQTGEKRVQRGRTPRGQKQTGVLLAFQLLRVRFVVARVSFRVSWNGRRKSKSALLRAAAAEGDAQTGQLEAVDPADGPVARGTRRIRRGAALRLRGRRHRAHDGGGGAPERAEHAALARQLVHVHRRGGPRQAVRETLHRGESARQGFQSRRRLGDGVARRLGVVAVAVAFGVGRGENRRRVQQVHQRELARHDTLRDPHGGAGFALGRKRDPAYDRRALTRDARAVAVALEQTAVDHRARVLGVVLGVAVQVAVAALPKRVLLKQRGGQQAAQVARGHELLPALVFVQVARHHERARGGAQPRRREQVPLARVRERRVPVRVDVRQAPRGLRREHQRAAEPPAVALHAVHLHERRIAQNDNLGQSADAVFYAVGFFFPSRFFLLGVRRARHVAHLAVAARAGLEAPRPVARAPRVLGQLREAREARHRPVDGGQRHEELHALQVLRGGAGDDGVEPLGDPALGAAQAGGAGGGDGAGNCAGGAGEPGGDLRVGEQRRVRAHERVLGRASVPVPQLHVVPQSHQAHPQAVFRAANLRAVHDNLAGGVVVVAVVVVVVVERRGGGRRAGHRLVDAVAAAVAARAPVGALRALLRGAVRGQGGAERRREVWHLADRALERLEPVLAHGELAQLRVHLHLHRHRRHRAHPVRVGKGRFLLLRAARLGRLAGRSIRSFVGSFVLFLQRRSGSDGRRLSPLRLGVARVPPLRDRHPRRLRRRRGFRLGDEPPDAARPGDAHPPPVDVDRRDGIARGR